jgi:hypothetical protein
MPRYIFSPSIELSLQNRSETLHERRDRYRGELKIATPVVSEELRKKWYGAPPSKVELKRRPNTSAF